MTYHMTRKAMSVVKSTWNPKVVYDPWGNPTNQYAGWSPFSKQNVREQRLAGAKSKLPRRNRSLFISQTKAMLAKVGIMLVCT
jgi:hypothetical protein